MTRLVLAVKAVYFDEIAAGTKVHEFREDKAYWEGRLVDREYTEVEITKGYPAADDTARRIVRPYRGFDRRTICHPHFGAEPVNVFAIHLTDWSYLI